MVEGNLPPGWRLAEFDEVATIAPGLIDPRDPRQRDKLHIGPENIASGGGLTADPLRTAGEIGLISGKFVFNRGDIVYSKVRPNLNKVIRPNFSGLCSADMYVIRAKSTSCSQQFLFHVLRGERFYKQAVAASMRSGLPKVNRDDLATMLLVIPPLGDQNTISAALDNCDRAIAAADALVAAKRQAKRALAQQLLRTGEPMALTDVAEVLFSGVDKLTIAGELPVRLCNYMDVYTNERITADLPLMLATATPQEARRFGLQAGDVLFTKDSETADDIAAAAFVPEDMPGVVCGYHLGLARPRENLIRGDFLAQVMAMPSTRAQFTRAANGVVRFGLTLAAMEQIVLHVPALARQEAVAGALHALDDEIDVHRRQTDLLRCQKRGLMQKLLTGAWTRSAPLAAAASAAAV